MGPGEGVRGRVQPLAEILEHLGLALEDKHVRSPHRTDVQGLEARIQDENLLHGEIVDERGGADARSALRKNELEQVLAGPDEAAAEVEIERPAIAAADDYL